MENNADGDDSNNNNNNNCYYEPYIFDKPYQEELCIDFCLRMKLRRKLLSRIIRRLLRIAVAMDGNDVNPPSLPKFGDLRLHIDEEQISTVITEHYKRHDQAIQYIKELKQQQDEKEDEDWNNTTATTTTTSTSPKKEQENLEMMVSSSSVDDVMPDHPPSSSPLTKLKSTLTTTTTTAADAIVSAEVIGTQYNNDVEKDMTMIEKQQQQQQDESLDGKTKNDTNKQEETGKDSLKAMDEEEPDDINEAKDGNKDEKYNQKHKISDAALIEEYYKKRHSTLIECDYEVFMDYKDMYEKEIDLSTGQFIQYTVLKQQQKEAPTNANTTSTDVVSSNYNNSSNNVGDMSTIGVGIGATNTINYPTTGRSSSRQAAPPPTMMMMNPKEREIEWKRYKDSLLARLPNQPTYAELGLEYNVYYADERRKMALEQKQKQQEEERKKAEAEAELERQKHGKENEDEEDTANKNNVTTIRKPPGGKDLAFFLRSRKSEEEEEVDEEDDDDKNNDDDKMIEDESEQQHHDGKRGKMEMESAVSEEIDLLDAADKNKQEGDHPSSSSEEDEEDSEDDDGKTATTDNRSLDANANEQRKKQTSKPEEHASEKPKLDEFNDHTANNLISSGLEAEPQHDEHVQSDKSGQNDLEYTKLQPFGQDEEKQDYIVEEKKSIMCDAQMVDTKDDTVETATDINITEKMQEEAEESNVVGEAQGTKEGTVDSKGESEKLNQMESTEREAIDLAVDKFKSDDETDGVETEETEKDLKGGSNDKDVVDSVSDDESDTAKVNQSEEVETETERQSDGEIDETKSDDESTKEEEETERTDDEDEEENVQESRMAEDSEEEETERVDDDDDDDDQKGDEVNPMNVEESDAATDQMDNKSPKDKMNLGSNDDVTSQEKRQIVDVDNAGEAEKVVPPKKIRPICLVAIPSFYEQDMNRIKLIHADLMAGSLHVQIRLKLEDSTQNYNTALKTSNEIYERRLRAQTKLNTLLTEKRNQNLNQDYAMQVAVKRNEWNKRRIQFEQNKLNNLLPSRTGKYRTGTNYIRQYMTIPDHTGIAHQVGDCLADIVDAVDNVASGIYRLEKFQEKFVMTPYFVDPTTGESLPQKQQRFEKELRQEIEELNQSLSKSEEIRNSSWKKMLKTKSEFSIPHEVYTGSGPPKIIQLDMNSVHTTPMPSLRQMTTQNLAHKSAPTRPDIGSYVPAVRRAANPRRPPTAPDVEMPQASTPLPASLDAGAAGGSESKYSAARVKARIGADGTVAPVSEPKVTMGGLFQRPAGRTRKGMEWDAIRGIWIPAPSASGIDDE